MASFTLAFTMIFKVIVFLCSTVLEWIEDAYLFWESHYDKQRDFEKLDDLINLAGSYGVQLLCSGIFAVCLALATWYNPPQLQHSSRKDLEAERDHAVNRVNQLEAENEELKAFSGKTLEDRNSTLDDYGRLATQKIILENKLAGLESKPDLESKCWDLEASLDQPQEQCRRLEASLHQSKRLSRDEDSAREAQSEQAKQAQTKILEMKARIAELEKEGHKKEASYKDRLTSLETARDQANQDKDRHAEASVAHKSKIGELERLLEAKDAAANDLKSKESENTRNQLEKITSLGDKVASIEAEKVTLQNQLQAKNAAAENLQSNESENTRNRLEKIARLEVEIAGKDAENSALKDQLRAQNAELERIIAQNSTERQSQRNTIEALQNDLDVQKNVMDVDIVPENSAMDVDIIPDHVCDHSQCADQASLLNKQIEEMAASVMGRDLKIDRLQAEGKNQGMMMEGLRHRIAELDATIAQLQQSVATSGPNADADQLTKLQKEVASLKGKVEDRDLNINALKKANQEASRRSNDAAKKAGERLRAKDKELDGVKADQQKNLDTHMAIFRERYAAGNPLREELASAKKSLAEMTANRDRCRDANEAYWKQTFAARTAVEEREEAQRVARRAAEESQKAQRQAQKAVEEREEVRRAAQKAVEEGEKEQRAVEEQRDGLVQAIGQLQGKMARMVEVESVEEMDEGQALKKRRNDGDEDNRPAKILRDE